MFVITTRKRIEREKQEAVVDMISSYVSQGIIDPSKFQQCANLKEFDSDALDTRSHRYGGANPNDTKC